MVIITMVAGDASRKASGDAGAGCGGGEELGGGREHAAEVAAARADAGGPGNVALRGEGELDGGRADRP
jgi:hypothetical protein